MKNRIINSDRLTIFWAFNYYNLNGIRLSKKVISDTIEEINLVINEYNPNYKKESNSLIITPNTTKDKIEFIITTTDESLSRICFAKICFARKQNTIYMDNILLSYYDTDEELKYQAVITANLCKDYLNEYHAMWLEHGINLTNIFANLIITSLHYISEYKPGMGSIYATSSIGDVETDYIPIIFRVEEITVKH